MTSLKLIQLLKSIIHAETTLKSARRQGHAFTRTRKMPFVDALCFLLDMRKTTIQTRLNMFFGYSGEKEPMSQQAFSKLRANFDHSPFKTMVRELVINEYSDDCELPLWNGYHVFGVDGSYLQLPRNTEMYSEFGIRGQQGQCPCAGISVLFDVLHGWALDPVITGAKMNERWECEKHIEFLCHDLAHIAKNSIVLLDRGYPSLDFFDKLQTSGLKFVARCKSRFLREINDAPLGDSIVTLKNGMPVRVVKFVLFSGEIETLATNLFDVAQAQFPDLYAMRWGIETAYFRLKRELCVEKFSGKTQNSIYQDFWASMVLLNSVSVFQREADEAVQKRQKGKQTKHLNLARTSDLIITLRDRFVFAVLCGHHTFCDLEIERVIKTMARVVSPVRPGRSFPRVHKPFLVTNHNLKSHL